MTANRTDFYNRTSRMCEACPPAYGNYSNYTCNMCGNGNATVDYFNRANGTCMSCDGNNGFHYDMGNMRCTNCTSN